MRAVTNPLQRAFNSCVQLLGLGLKQIKLWLGGCVTWTYKWHWAAPGSYRHLWWEHKVLQLAALEGVSDTILNPASTGTWEGHMEYLWMSL